MLPVLAAEESQSIHERQHEPDVAVTVQHLEVI